jgi:hypothetical protein
VIEPSGRVFENTRDLAGDFSSAKNAGVTPIKEKLVQHRLRWFGHVQRRPPESSERSGGARPGR